MPNNKLKNPTPAAQNVSEQYLERDGLSFKFDAGQAPWQYHVAIGSDHDDALAGGADRDYLWGRGGNDHLAGMLENDNLYGGGGDDVITGGMGVDLLVGGSGADSLYGGGDGDAVRAGAGNDYVDEGAGHGDLDGGPGNDILVGGQGADAFMVMPGMGDDVIKDFTAGPGMFDHLAIMGLHWSDLNFADTSAGVRVSFEGGSVLLEGVYMADLTQDDFMFGDEPELPPASRAPDGPTPERPSPSSDGPATVSGSEPGPAFGNFAQGQMHNREFEFTFADEEMFHVLVGTAAADTLQATDAWDEYFGRDGNDVLAGGGGSDVLQGDAGDDQLSGGAGQDRLDGGPGMDQLSGGDEEDNLMGGDGNDTLDAGAGHDMLNGGKGDDIYIGGAGADAFMVMPDSGNDVVRDFEATGAAQGAFDHIALIDILPNQVHVMDTTNGALVSWDTTGDNTADGSILLQGVAMADLRQSDFMFNEQPAFVAGVSDVGSWYVFPA